MDQLLDDFTKIGLELTEPYSDDISRISNNIELNNRIRQEYEDKITNHNKEMLFNETDMSVEGFFDNTKQIKNNYSFSLSMLDSLNKDMKKLINVIYVDPSKHDTINILFNNICRSGTKINTSWIYKSAKLEYLFDDYKSLVNALKELNPNNTTSFAVSFMKLSKHIKETIKIICPDIDILSGVDSRFFTRLNDFNRYVDGTSENTKMDSWKILLGMSYKLTPTNSKEYPLESIVHNTDIIYDVYNICNWIGLCKVRFVKYNIKLMDEESFNNLNILLTFYSNFIKAFGMLLLSIITDIQNIISVIEPLESKDTDYKNLSLMKDIETIDPWISSDYHLLKEFRKGNLKPELTDEIIRMHNSVVKPNDVFLFLGDIGESEFFDNNMSLHISLLSKYCRKLNGQKILIVGNNDTGTDAFYKEIGFCEIYRIPVETQHYIFSHGPVEAKDKLNIHGHIHGSKEYWNLDVKNHIDCYFGLWGKPVKLSELKKYYETGMYTDCKSMRHSVDPESNKKPMDISN